MRMLKFLGTVVVLGWGFSVCTTTSGVNYTLRYGNGAQTSISPGYAHANSQKVVMVSFEESGRGGKNYDQDVTNKFTTKIMELGLYSIVDMNIARSYFNNSNWNAGLEIGQDQVKSLKSDPGVE